MTEHVQRARPFGADVAGIDGPRRVDSVTRMLRSRAPHGLSMFLAAALLVAGCSDDGTGEASDDVAPITTETAEQP